MAKSELGESNKSTLWDLSLYELSRTPQVTTEDDTEIVVTPQVADMELKCPICLDLLKNTVAAKECLHRFCSECITTALRTGNKECPTCRKKIVSRRSLRPDPNFDQIILKLFPDRNEVETYENKVFNAITKYSYRGKDALNRSKKASRKDLKQVETVTAPSSNSENIVQENMGNLLEGNDTCNEEMVRSSALLSSTELSDVRNQIGLYPITSFSADNVDPEDSINLETSRESRIDEQTILLSSVSDTTNDNIKSLELEASTQDDILLQPSTSAFALSTSCVNSEDSSTKTEETEMPRINEQAFISTQTDSDYVSEGNINLSSRELHLYHNIPLQPLHLFSLSSSSVDNEYNNTDSDEYKIYDQTAILSSTDNVTMNSVGFSYHPSYSLVENSKKHEQNKENDLNEHTVVQFEDDTSNFEFPVSLCQSNQSNISPKGDKENKLSKHILRASLSLEESNISLSLNLDCLNLSSDENNLSKQPKQILPSFAKKNTVTDDTECVNLHSQSERSISSKSSVLSSKDTGPSVTTQKSLEDDIKDKLNEKMNMFSLSTNDISTEDNPSDLASLSDQTTLSQTTKSASPDFDTTNRLSEKKLNKKKRTRRRKFGQQRHQKVVVSSSTDNTIFATNLQPSCSKLSSFKRSTGYNQNPNLESNINLEYPNAISSETNNELLQESSIPSEERNEQKYQDNVMFEEENTQLSYQRKRNTLSVKKKIVKSPLHSNKSTVELAKYKKYASSTACTSGSDTQAHSSNAGFIQESFEKSAETNEKTSMRKKRRKPASSTNTTSKNIELMLKLRPSEVPRNNQIQKVLCTNLIRFLKTTGNATINHLGKYLTTLVTDGLDKQTLETCDLSQFYFYVLSLSNGYIQLDGNQTLDQISSDHGKVGKLLEIFYSYKPS